MGNSADNDHAVLPDDWRIISVRELCNEIFGGGTPSTKNPAYWDGTIPWTTTAIIDEDAIYLNKFQRKITPEGLDNSSSQLAPVGSVLVGTRVGVGKTAVTTCDIAINQDLTALVLNNTVAPEFLALSLKQPTIQRWFEENKRGTTIKGLARQDLANLKIVLPPLPEQKAIAHVLRTVRQAKEATEKVIAATRQLKQSLMKHLFTYGPVPFDQADKVELKETDIGPVPKHWKVERLDVHWSSMLGKMLSPKARSGNSPRPYLRNANVQWGRIDLADLFEMDFKEDDYERYGLVPGDVLICEGGEVGRSAIWRGELKECYYQKALHRLRPRSNQMIPEFLLYHLRHAFLIRGCYGEVGTVTTIAHLPGVKLKALPIPVPPIAEQKQIIALLNGVEKKADTEELYLNSLSTNFGSLLHHLMTGKIRVPIETNQITAEAI